MTPTTATTATTAAPPELFYEISEPGSAAARRVVVELELLDRVRFRNVYYEEAMADFRARGGSQLPALWDGEHLIEGEAAVVAALRRLVPAP